MTENKFTSYYPIAYRLFFAALITGMVMLNIGYLAGIPRVGIHNWCVMGLTLLLLACLNYGKTGLKIIGSILLVFGVLVLIPLLSGGQLYLFYENYITWMFRFGEYNEQWKQGYQLMQTVWVSIACYGFQVVTECRNVIKNLTTLGVVVGLAVGLVLEENLPSLGVAFLVGYIMLWYVEAIRKDWNKRKQRDKKEYTLFLLPYFLAFMLLLTYLPASAQPYAWTTARMIYGRVYDEVTTWWEKINRNGIEDFGGTVAGFSEDGRILGSFTRQDKKLMTISGDIGLQTNLYLRGKTYDTFDGREWFKTVEEDKREYPMDTMETIYAIRRFDGKFQGNYIRAENAMVRYDFFNTQVLFTPLKLAKVKYDNYLIQGRDFSLEEMNGYGTEYELKYYQLNLDTPKFQELIEAKQTEDEKLWNNVVRSSGTVLKRAYSIEELLQYRQDMKDGYWQQVTLSQELQDYLEQVTYECETKYQKLRAIEKELSGYLYNKSPGKMPVRVQSQEDFLEYFLLETKEGYCAHYATAFVLLARAEGLPARYVEGFSVPITEEKVMDVYSGRAHAWPEVYFEGVGWIAFEPTPGYSELFYDGWEIKQPVEAKGEEAEEEIQETPPPIQEIPQETMEEIENKKLALKKEKDRERFLLVLKYMGWIVFVCLVVLLIERVIRNWRYRRMSLEEKFLVEVKRNLWIFARLGYKREEAETLSEVQDRIRQDVPELFAQKEELQLFTGYEEYLYRTKEVTDAILKAIIEEQKELLVVVKEGNRGYYYMLKLRMWLSPVW